MALVSLTEKEKSVFYNLIKYPELNDIELSEKIGINRSTVTSIKNRFKSKGLFKTYVVPNLPALGCNIISVMYGKYKISNSGNQALKGELDCPELIYARSADTVFVYIYASADFSDIKKCQDEFIMHYGSQDIIDRVYTVHFPTKISEANPIFNYSDIIAKLFDFNLNGDSSKIFWDKKYAIEMTKVEKSVLHALIKYPELNSLEIAKKIGKTRSTVSKIRSKMLSGNIIKVINKPATEILGSELLVFFHARFNPKYPRNKRDDQACMNMKLIYPFFKVSGDMESVGLFVPKNYTDYTNSYNKTVSHYKDLGYILNDPYTMILPIEKITARKLDFSGLVEKLLFNGKH